MTQLLGVADALRPDSPAGVAKLRSLGLDVADVRTGKEITVRFDASDGPAAQAAAAKMGEELLANPVIEDFAIEVAAE